MRHCNLCRRHLTGCFGFVRAKDYLDVLNGKKKTVRELCGICVEKVLRRLFRVPKGEPF